ncbi:MAG TPA: tetratricopeptide repeat protein [Verrucomicrobiae bacterium]|nr:tetratricopeptide repeat protein [Verrucomicrobiae bacterium]
MRRFFAILFVVVCAGKILAADIISEKRLTADAENDFHAANRLYAEGKFSDAANLYEIILQHGAASPNLLFNYGNAEFKSGNLGKAIAAFRRAELLAPRDSEIRANLTFARNQVQGATVRESFWQNWLENFSLNEWTIFAAIAFWLTFILLAAKQLNPALAPRLKSATWIFAMLTIFCGTILSVKAANHFSRQTAVVISAEATARSGPFDDAQNAFTARDGAELSVLDRRDDWVQVADGSGKIGWLPTKQVEILPGA